MQVTTFVEGEVTAEKIEAAYPEYTRRGWAVDLDRTEKIAGFTVHATFVQKETTDYVPAAGEVHTIEESVDLADSDAGGPPPEVLLSTGVKVGDVTSSGKFEEEQGVSAGWKEHGTP
jgi:hypothetical protein